MRKVNVHDSYEQLVVVDLGLGLGQLTMKLVQNQLLYNLSCVIEFVRSELQQDYVLNCSFREPFVVNVHLNYLENIISLVLKKWYANGLPSNIVNGEVFVLHQCFICQQYDKTFWQAFLARKIVSQVLQSTIFAYHIQFNFIIFR